MTDFANGGFIPPSDTSILDEPLSQDFHIGSWFCHRGELSISHDFIHRLREGAVPNQVLNRGVRKPSSVVE